MINGDTGSTKSDAGRRIIGLPLVLVQLVAEHKSAQSRERVSARQVGTKGTGSSPPRRAALVPNSDYHRWRTLLKAAGARDARLHDARLTAATVLLILGVPERTVTGIMGWSCTFNGFPLSARHRSHSARRGCPGSGLIWVTDQPEFEPAETKTETRADRE